VSESQSQTAVESEPETGVEAEPRESGLDPETGVEAEPRESGLEPKTGVEAEQREPGLDPEAGQEERPEPEPELDPEAAARRAAALAQVRQFGDPVLRTKARAIDRFDDALREEIERMGHLMDDAIGVGLAATQVGVVHRLLVYRVQQGAELAALINPEVEWSGRDTETMEEGCLSLPGVLVDVDRPVHVRVRALNERGEPILIEASGLEARVIQHEIDHLDGVLILDRTSREQRKEAMRVLREAQQAA
jgi:peptide deformylase